MPLDLSCQIPTLSKQGASEIDSLAPNTVLVLTLDADGVLRPISTGKVNVRKITESELRQLRALLQGFPDQFAVTKVEVDPYGCQVVNGVGGGYLFRAGERSP